MIKNKLDYVDVIYGKKGLRTSEGKYPNQLIDYLIRTFKIKLGSKVLDVGCGSGDFLNAFVRAGLQGYGVDFSDAAISNCQDSVIRIVDLENERIPFEDNSFDLIFSKSVLEHFHNPEIPIKEMYRVLKPDGLIINLVPSWEYCWDIYYEDYTHRTPFMLSAFRDLHILEGFNQVETSFFTQLPATWNDPIKLWTTLAFITRNFVPSYYRYRFKWVRFSKEIMLLCVARK